MVGEKASFPSWLPGCLAAWLARLCPRETLRRTTSERASELAGWLASEGRGLVCLQEGFHFAGKKKGGGLMFREELSRLIVFSKESVWV